MKRYRYIFYFLISLIFLGCEDYLNKVPVDSIVDQNAITDLKSAQAAVDGLYYTLSGFYFSKFFYSYGNLSDENTDILWDGNGVYSLNSVQPINTNWSSSGKIINMANHIIEKVPVIESIPSGGKDKFVGEAKFLRALEYLLLAQFFGDVPWTESTDYRVVQNLSRTPVAEVMANVIRDLEEAESGLPASYDDVGGDRFRITRGAATALLARAYLYRQNWPEAEAKASEVINNSSYQLAVDYEDVFVDNSNEGILEYFYQDLSTQGISAAEIFLSESVNGEYISTYTDKMANAFEDGDVRKDYSISVDGESLPYVSKYRNTGANQEVKILRLAEMYLIRAEARAQQGDIPGAAEDVNVIRNRAGLPNTTAGDKASMLLAIEQERFVELCFEGHRWIDIVRTGRANEIMSVFNPVGWDPTDVLLPIPQSEIDKNPNLTQNPGY